MLRPVAGEMNARENHPSSDTANSASEWPMDESRRMFRYATMQRHTDLLPWATPTTEQSFLGNLHAARIQRRRFPTAICDPRRHWLVSDTLFGAQEDRTTAKVPHRIGWRGATLVLPSGQWTHNLTKPRPLIWPRN